MKQLLTVILLIISGAAIAQSTPQKKVTQKKDTLRASVDYFMKIDGIDGESPDTLPPAPSLLTLSAGGTMSQTHNTNLLGWYAVQQKPGFIFAVGYAQEFKRGRLQAQAAYFKGGLTVASGDVNGDGKEDYSDLDLNYISIPVQYQFYLGKTKRFFAGAGLDAAYLLSKKYSGTRPVLGHVKVFDGSVIASAGVWVNRNILVQAGYRYGLIDIDLDEDNKARNGMAFLTLSYAFYSKIKYGPVIKIKPKG